MTPDLDLFLFRAGKRHGAGSIPGSYSGTTSPRSQILRELGMGRRVVAVDAATEHGDRRAVRIEGATVRLAVDAASHPADDPVLERLAQRLEHRARELRELVEEEDALVRECAGMSLESQASVDRMKIFNLNSDEWDATRDRERWRCSGTLVGERIGGELLGATMSEIEPGSRLWPYHTHYLNEEWVIVLRGEPTLRTPEGEHVLEEGDIVCFPRGKIGAHQISNRTDSPVRVLMLSSMIRGEIIEYLDTGKVFAGVDEEDVMFARPGPAVEYWEGED